MDLENDNEYLISESILNELYKGCYNKFNEETENK
jgi:hypothetical protein